MDRDKHPPSPRRWRQSPPTPRVSMATAGSQLQKRRRNPSSALGTSEKGRRKELGKGLRVRRAPYLWGVSPAAVSGGGPRARSPARSDDVRGAEARHPRQPPRRHFRPAFPEPEPAAPRRHSAGGWRKSPSLPPFRGRGLPPLLAALPAAGQLPWLPDDGDGATW